jgi:uncharacterized protein involved in propanediol utilization
MKLTGRGICNGSFGEILQGVLPGHRKFLVNLKIKNASRVRLQLMPTAYSSEKEARYADSYRIFPKSYKVVRNILSDVGRHDDCLLEISSDIPVGKGCASSTADMVASIKALSAAISIALRAEYVSQMLTEIEPNDGIHFSGTAVYHHAIGELIFRSDFIPRWNILGIDFGGTIDTVKFNLMTFAWSEAQMTHYMLLLERVKRALQDGDSEELCRIATESAVLWQEINPKPGLEAAMGFMRDSGGLGVLNTHSGTYLGIIYPDGTRNAGETLRAAQSAFVGCGVQWFETTSCAEKV